jgi:hypothetical protein
MTMICSFSRQIKATTTSERGRAGMVWSLALLCLLTLPTASGCKSNSPSHYVSPRVIGRVLNEQTHLPIAGVQIKRVVPNYEAGTLDQVKGGEALQKMNPVRSATDGTFNLDSQKSVTFFRQIAWFSVEISFKHSDFENFTTNYTPSQAVFSANGEAVIHAGDIWLKPRIKLNH